MKDPKEVTLLDLIVGLLTTPISKMLKPIWEVIKEAALVYVLTVVGLFVVLFVVLFSFR